MFRLPSMLLTLLEDEDSQEDFISDLKDVVEQADVNLWTMSFKQVVEDEDEERINILFVLEKIMQLLGLISSKKHPTENSMVNDPFTSSYTTYDVILVVCFLYISIIDKGAMRNPSNHRLVQEEDLVGSRRVSQDNVNDRNMSRNTYKDNKVGRQKLREKWMPIEDKLLVHHWCWLQFVEKSSNNEDAEHNADQLLRYTKARKDAFSKWSSSGNDEDEDQTIVPQSNFLSLSKGVRKEDVLAQIKAMQGRR